MRACINLKHSGRHFFGQINLQEKSISIETEANNKTELYCSRSVLWQTLWSKKYTPHLIWARRRIKWMHWRKSYRNVLYFYCVINNTWSDSFSVWSWILPCTQLKTAVCKLRVWFKFTWFVWFYNRKNKSTASRFWRNVILIIEYLWFELLKIVCHSWNSVPVNVVDTHNTGFSDCWEKVTQNNNNNHGLCSTDGCSISTFSLFQVFSLICKTVVRRRQKHENISGKIIKKSLVVFLYCLEALKM